MGSREGGDTFTSNFVSNLRPVFANLQRTCCILVRCPSPDSQLTGFHDDSSVLCTLEMTPESPDPLTCKAKHRYYGLSSVPTRREEEGGRITAVCLAREDLKTRVWTVAPACSNPTCVPLPDLLNWNLHLKMITRGLGR